MTFESHHIQDKFWERKVKSKVPGWIALTVHFDDDLVENFLHNKFYIRIRFVKLWPNPKFKWNDPKTKSHIIVNVMDTQSPLRHGHEYRVIDIEHFVIEILKNSSEA